MDGTTSGEPLLYQGLNMKRCAIVEVHLCRKFVDFGGQVQHLDANIAVASENFDGFDFAIWEWQSLQRMSM